MIYNPIPKLIPSPLPRIPCGAFVYLFKTTH